MRLINRQFWILVFVSIVEHVDPLLHQTVGDDALMWSANVANACRHDFECTTTPCDAGATLPLQNKTLEPIAYKYRACQLVEAGFF